MAMRPLLLTTPLATRIFNTKIQMLAGALRLNTSGTDSSAPPGRQGGEPAF